MSGKLPCVPGATLLPWAPSWTPLVKLLSPSLARALGGWGWGSAASSGSEMGPQPGKPTLHSCIQPVPFPSALAHPPQREVWGALWGPGVTCAPSCGAGAGQRTPTTSTSRVSLTALTQCQLLPGPISPGLNQGLQPLSLSGRPQPASKGTNPSCSLRPRWVLPTANQAWGGALCTRAGCRGPIRLSPSCPPLTPLYPFSPRAALSQTLLLSPGVGGGRSAIFFSFFKIYLCLYIFMYSFGGEGGGRGRADSPLSTTQSSISQPRDHALS